MRGATERPVGKKDPGAGVGAGAVSERNAHAFRYKGGIIWPRLSRHGAERNTCAFRYEGGRQLGGSRVYPKAAAISFERSSMRAR